MNKIIMLAAMRNNFNPTKISGLKLWLDASDPSTLYTTSGMTTHATADADPVGGWADKSGQGNHVTETVAGERPALKLNIVNGRPVVRFASASTQSLKSASVNTIPKVAPYTVYAVVKITALNGNRRIIAAESGLGKGWYFGNLTGKGVFRSGKTDVAGRWDGVMPTFSTVKYELVVMAVDATFDAKYYVNGGLRDYILTTSDSGAGDVVYRIGGDGLGTNWWDGDIAEVIVREGQDSDAIRTQHENYLSRKYAITKSPTVQVGSYLTIPDYPALGTVVHPDVLYFAAGWNGYKYWMAYTPFPPAANENPSIAVSNDGNTWITPPGLTNPIATPAAGANNHDASLCMSSDGTTTMWCIWGEYKAATYERIYVAASTDGITYGAPALILDLAMPGVDPAMSPAVLWDGAQFVMYTCNSTGAYTIDRRTCATMDGVWSAAAAITWTNPSVLSNKHVDVILASDAKYYLIFMDVDSGVNAGLYFASSTDGSAFTLDPNFRVPAQVGVWDYLPYRACLVEPVAGAGFDIYYSGFNAAGTVAKIAKTHYTP